MEKVHEVKTNPKTDPLYCELFDKLNDITHNLEYYYNKLKPMYKDDSLKQLIDEFDENGAEKIKTANECLMDCMLRLSEVGHSCGVHICKKYGLLNK